MSPLLEPETTLKDAFSMLIEADVQAGIVVDPAGRVRGFVTTDGIERQLRDRG
jgi:CBS domain-containing protein